MKEASSLRTCRKGDEVHAECEHHFFVFYCKPVCYGSLLFVLRDWVPGKYMFVHKNGPFRGCNPGNCNAVHVFPAYCGWGRSGMDGPGVYVSEGKA